MNHDLDVLSRLAEYHDHISAPYVPLADDLQRGRRRVRRTRAVVGGSIAITLASVVAAVSLSARDRVEDPPRPAEQPGLGILSSPLVAPESVLDVRELGFHVERVPDVVLTGSWAIEPDRQSTAVKIFGGARSTDVEVDVYYQGSSPSLPSTGEREAVDVNGVEGTYVVQTDGEVWAAHLLWEYAPDSWADVHAREESAQPADLRNRLHAVAEAVRSGGEPVRIPFRVGTVPSSLPSLAAADSVSVSDRDGVWSTWVSFGEIHLWATSLTAMDCQGSDGSPFTEDFTYTGLSGCLVDGRRIGLRLGPANAFIDFVDGTPDVQASTEDMKQLLADITVASSDVTTWFDLRTALGGSVP